MKLLYKGWEIRESHHGYTVWAYRFPEGMEHAGILVERATFISTLEEAQRIQAKLEAMEWERNACEQPRDLIQRLLKLLYDKPYTDEFDAEGVIAAIVALEEIDSKLWIVSGGRMPNGVRG